MKALLLTACAVLAACGGGRETDPPEDERADQAFDPLTKQIERAEAVEDVVEQHKRDVDAALEEAEDE